MLESFIITVYLLRILRQVPQDNWGPNKLQVLQSLSLCKLSRNRASLLPASWTQPKGSLNAATQEVPSLWFTGKERLLGFGSWQPNCEGPCTQLLKFLKGQSGLKKQYVRVLLLTFKSLSKSCHLLVLKFSFVYDFSSMVLPNDAVSSIVPYSAMMASSSCSHSFLV